MRKGVSRHSQVVMWQPRDGNTVVASRDIRGGTFVANDIHGSTYSEDRLRKLPFEITTLVEFPHQTFQELTEGADVAFYEQTLEGKSELNLALRTGSDGWMVYQVRLVGGFPADCALFETGIDLDTLKTFKRERA